MINCKFSFFINLVEKNSFTVKKTSKCRENGIDRGSGPGEGEKVRGGGGGGGGDRDT